MLLQRKFVKLSQISMCYLDNNIQHTNVIIFIHGWMESKFHFISFALNFQTDYRIIIPDLRGHGESSCPDSNYDLCEFSNDLSEFIERLFDKSERFILVGHSLGGMVITNLANKIEKRIQGLIFLNSSLNFVDFNPIIGLIDRILHKLLRNNTYYLALLTRLAFGLRPKSKAIRIEQSSIINTKNFVALRSFRNAVLKADHYQMLYNLRIPVLSIGGAFDPLLPLLHARKIANNAQFGYFRLIPRAGHFVMMEDRERVEYYFNEFLGLINIR